MTDVTAQATDVSGSGLLIPCRLETLQNRDGEIFHKAHQEDTLSPWVDGAESSGFFGDRWNGVLTTHIGMESVTNLTSTSHELRGVQETIRSQRLVPDPG